MYFLPENVQCYIKVSEDSEFLTCLFVRDLGLCPVYQIEQLQPHKLSDEKEDLAGKLISVEEINNFVIQLWRCLSDGINCIHYQELKRRELFILLRVYYSKEALALFFSSISGTDMDFKEFVFHNFVKVKEIEELADMLNMTLVTFQRKFKREFNVSPHLWFQARKKEFLYHAIINTSKSFDDISMEFGFSSASYLGTFCKRHFKMLPSQIRRMKQGR